MSINCTRFRTVPALIALICLAALAMSAILGIRTAADLVAASVLAVATVMAVRAVPPCSVRVEDDQLHVRWPWGRTRTLDADDVTRMRIDITLSSARFLIASRSLRLFQVEAHLAPEPLTAIEQMCIWAAEASDDQTSTTQLREAARSARERRTYIENGDQNLS